MQALPPAGRDRSLAAPPAAWLLLIVMVTVSALIVVILGAKLTFFNDDWYFLLQRPGLESSGGLDTLLAPHNGNLVALLALSYKLLVGVFGLGSQLPFRLVMALTLAGLGGLVFVFVNDRLGPVAGLAATAVILFLGPAWEDLLFYTALLDLAGAMVFGIAALLALESDTQRRNAIASVLLVCSISMSNAGVPFVVGGAIAIALRRRPRQLWIPGVPAVLFGLWWAFYGSKQPSGLSLANIEHLPRYVLDSVSAGLASLTGLNHSGAAAALARGHIIAAILAAALVLCVFRGRRPGAGSLVLGGTALAFWCLTGASFIVGREPTASRYQLIDATLLILLGAEMLRGVQLPRRALAFLSLAAVLVVASNLDALGHGFDFMRKHSEVAEADLGALQIAGGLAPPRLALLEPVARDPYLSGVTAGRYFAQTRAHGSPAFYTPVKLATAAPAARQGADSVLTAADRVAAQPTNGHGATGTCRRLAIGIGSAGSSLPLSHGLDLVRNLSAGPLVIGVSRFAPEGMPIPIGFVAPRSSVRLVIPPDSFAPPWRVSIRNPTGAPDAGAFVCRA
jgi:hypothetical protein